MLKQRGNYFLLIIAFFVSSLSAHGETVQFFNDGIDYWEGAKPKPEKKGAPQKEPIRKGEDTKKTADFNWATYMDPKNDEFFREGDYKPPEPFLELVRNPSDKNIKMWFAYIEKKNILTQRLQKRLAEYTALKMPFPTEGRVQVEDNSQRFSVPADDFERYRFRMYFDSTCPHCQKMFATLNDLQDRGYFVEARQIDKGPLDKIRSNVSIVAATPEEVRRFNISAVPVLLAGDLKKKTVYRQTGFATPEEILSNLRTK